MMQPGRIVVPVRRQIDFENPVHAGNVSLKIPGLFLRPIGGYVTLDLVGDDSPRIGSGRCSRLSAEIIVEDSPLPQRLVVYFLILDGVLMTIGTDAPGMEVIELFVFGVAGNDLRVLATAGAQDLEHPPLPFRGPAIGRHGDQPVIEQHHRPGICRVGRQLAGCGLNHPIGKGVGRKGRVGRHDSQVKQDRASDERPIRSLIPTYPRARLPKPPG